MFWNPKYLQYFTPLIRASRNLNWRFGRPFKGRSHDLERVRQVIAPGMVILTHKEYELSNFFIPGYWTHSALAISRDQVVDASSKGVQMNKLHEFFFSHDDFIVLKPRFCNAEMMAKACRHATDALGAPYSFDFSLRNNRIYCTALVYTAYMKSCGWHPNNTTGLPKGFRELTEGKIVIPNDIFLQQEHWEVVYPVN